MTNISKTTDHLVFEAKLRSFDVDVKLQFIWFLGQTTFVKAINGPYSELGFKRAYLVRGTAFYSLFFVPNAFCSAWLITSRQVCRVQMIIAGFSRSRVQNNPWSKSRAGLGYLQNNDECNTWSRNKINCGPPNALVKPSASWFFVSILANSIVPFWTCSFKNRIKMFGRFWTFKSVAKMNTSNMILPYGERNTWWLNTGFFAKQLDMNCFFHAVGNCIHFWFGADCAQSFCSRLDQLIGPPFIIITIPDVLLRVFGSPA